MSDLSSGLRPEFLSDDFPAGILRVTSFTIDEEVSSEATCQITATCDRGLMEPRALLHQFATLVLLDDGGSELRRFNGLVSSAGERATRGEGRQELRFTLRSPLHALDHWSDYRIYQEQTTQAIVSDVLSRAGIPDSMVEWRLGSPARERVTCTQYGQTHRQFIEALLEEDGIFWYLLHTEEGSKVVFGSGTAAWSSGRLTQIPQRRAGGMIGEESFTKVGAVARLRPKKFTLRDHDFKKPSLDLESSVEADTALGREHYEYPGGYEVPADGHLRAAVLRDAHVAAASFVEAVGQAPSLCVGCKVSVIETVGAHHDGDYCLIALRHHWRRATAEQGEAYDTRARLLPQAFVFAPPAKTARPPARSDTALVTVPPGEEIHCDEHGRVKVQFHWDRYGAFDDKSSGWIRVGQMHTSGSVVIPRDKWEVWVEYEDGDPEKGVVLGRLYNGAMPPSDALPAGQRNSVLMSKSTPGGGGLNQIRMNDGGGSELISIHAQKDMNLVVANDKTEKVTTSATVGVGVNQAVTVGASQTENVSSTDKVTVGGSQKYQVGASRTKTVSGDEQHDVKGARSVSIGASHTTLTPMSSDVNTSGNLTETVSGLCLEAAALVVAMAVAGSASISVGAAKIEAVASGKTDLTIGARASTVGGAFVNVTPKDITFATKGVKANVVGGAWLANAGGDVEISSKSSIDIMVGGAIAFTAASKIVMKVGASSVTFEGGKVVFDSPEIKITSSAIMAETAATVGSK